MKSMTYACILTCRYVHSRIRCAHNSNIGVPRTQFLPSWSHFFDPIHPYIGLAVAEVNITKLATLDNEKNSLPFSSGIVCTCIQKKLDWKFPDDAD